jgi:hypothetical protein
LTQPASDFVHGDLLGKRKGESILPQRKDYC